MLRRFACVAAVGAALVAPSQAAVPSIPSIYVDYSANCTFTLSVDGGTTVTPETAPGPTLPPGTYQLLVWFPNPVEGYACAKPVFSFAGPGASSVTEFRGQELLDERVLVLQPSATYVAEDTTSAATRRFFSTAATGSSTSLLGPAVSGAPTGASVQPELIGSAILHYRGKLAAAVRAAGKAALTQDGLRVATLRAGKYDIAVNDEDAHAGFFVRRGGRKAVAVTSAAFVGRRTRRVALAAGRWTYYSRAGAPVAFTVVL